MLQPFCTLALPRRADVAEAEHKKMTVELEDLKAQRDEDHVHNMERIRKMKFDLDNQQKRGNDLFEENLELRARIVGLRATQGCFNATFQL